MQTWGTPVQVAHPAVMNRRRAAVALGALATVAAIALVLGAGGLWGHKSSRGAVDRYIENVDRVQQQMRLPLTQLLTVYRSFSTHGTTPQVQQRLAGAEQTLRTLELRLAALTAPAAAGRLQRLLVRLVQQERFVAREVEQLAVFQPRFHTLVGESRLAETRLGLALGSVRPPQAHSVRGSPTKIAQARAAYAAAAARASAAQAGAIDAYDRSLVVVVRRLRALRPPPLMTPAYAAQVRTLVATEAAGGALVRELHKKNRARVPLLSRRLSEAARIAGSVSAQQAEIAAIKAYDARVEAVGTTQGLIQREITRLQNGGS